MFISIRCAGHNPTQGSLWLVQIFGPYFLGKHAPPVMACAMTAPSYEGAKDLAGGVYSSPVSVRSYR